MEIIDNFLKLEKFNELQTLMMSHGEFPWYYNDTIVTVDDDHGEFQFTHIFYQYNLPDSQYYMNLDPITVKLKQNAIIRIKANLLMKTPEIIQFPFHIDIDHVESPYTTSVFHVNTNNGHTIFKDGTKVESVANRMVIFPGNMYHTGTTCTDEQRRVIINFNYFQV
jgi:hypothetical protein